MFIQNSKKNNRRKETRHPVEWADADIDNDGDTDSSDEYLHKRRSCYQEGNER